MKKILSLLLAICLLFCLAACGKNNNVSTAESNPTIKDSSAENDESTSNGCTHSYNESIVEREATCQHEGAKSRTCKKCGFIETEIIKQLEHTIVVDNGKKSTCTELGLKDGKHCSVCNYVIQAQEPILATGHTYDHNKDETCNICGFKRILNCKHQNQITVKGKSPSCTASGFSDGKICKDCETLIKQQVSIAAKGHKWGDWRTIKEATAISEGISQRKCGNCSATENKTIAKKEHYIKLSKTNITVEEGLQSEKIGIEFSVQNIKDTHMVFSQSNEIVGISWKSTLKDGFYITGNKAGTTVLTITNLDMPGASATLHITVTPKTAVQGITLNKTHIDGKIGKAYELNANITPSNAQVQYVKWTSSNEKVATIFPPNMNKNIMVNAVGEGTATITATTYDGNFVATCTITVSAIPVQGIEITTSIKMNYYKGETLQLKYRITPYDATNQKVTWTSSNTEIATVDSNGLVTFIKGIVAKNVVIKVTTEDGKYSDYVTLYCVPDKIE